MKENMKNLLLTALISLCFNVGFAQTTAKSSTSKETQTVVKLKKDGTPDKRYTPQISSTSNSGSIKLKKDGTPDKRYSASKEKAEAAPVQSRTVNKPRVPNTSTTKSYTPGVDRSLKGPNGEEILTGPRGGKYYINKNGNKTYIKRN